MKTVIITNLNTKANFALSTEGGGTLSFNHLVNILSRLSHKGVNEVITKGVKYKKELKA